MTNLQRYRRDRRDLRHRTGGHPFGNAAFRISTERGSAMDVTKYADGYQIVHKPVGFTVIGPDAPATSVNINKKKGGLGPGGR